MDDDGNLVVFRRAGRSFSWGGMRRFAARLRDEVAGGREFDCLLTDDRELRRLNREFLGKDYPTDVLSFPAQEADVAEADPPTPLGEMAISVNRAREQAERFGHSTTEELCILMLHGLLHLMGHDHERDRGKMARTERRWRTALGLPTGLIERAKK